MNLETYGGLCVTLGFSLGAFTEKFHTSLGRVFLLAVVVLAVAMFLSRFAVRR